MRIYLAGPMRHLPEYNYPAFDKAAAKLRLAGHTVFSPAENDREKGYSDMLADQIKSGDAVPQSLQRTIILDDLTWICKNADAIAFLPGWDGSTVPPAAEANPRALPGLKCEYLGNHVHYNCTWNGSSGAKVEAALAEFLGLAKIDIPREWIT